jgi:hypothetical protein
VEDEKVEEAVAIEGSELRYAAGALGGRERARHAATGKHAKAMLVEPRAGGVQQHSSTRAYREWKCSSC